MPILFGSISDEPAQAVGRPHDDNPVGNAEHRATCSGVLKRRSPAGECPSLRNQIVAFSQFGRLSPAALPSEAQCKLGARTAAAPSGASAFFGVFFIIAPPLQVPSQYRRPHPPRARRGCQEVKAAAGSNSGGLAACKRGLRC